MYIHVNMVYFFFKTLGREAENNSVRYSISDQCYFYAKYDKNASTNIEHVLKSSHGTK